MDPELEEGAPAEGGDTGPSLDEALDDAIGLTETPAEAAVEPEATPADAPAEPAPADPVAAPEPVPAGSEKPAEPKDPNAELYAPLPEHNPRRTHERFQKLVEGHKEVRAKLEVVEQEREQFKGRVEQYEQAIQPLRDMGFNTPEAVADLQQFSEYRNALASGNVDQAIEVLQMQLRQLALASGRSIDVNPLAGFQDLDQRVQVGELDQTTAMELARARHLQGVQQQRDQQTRQVEQSHAQQMQVIHQGATQVDQVVQQLQRDPDFQRVLPELEKQLPSIKTGYPPHMWAQEVRRAYETEARILRLQAQQGAPRTPTPLRGNGHAGGQPAPRSTVDAVLQSLGFD